MKKIKKKSLKSLKLLGSLSIQRSSESCWATAELHEAGHSNPDMNPTTTSLQSTSEAFQQPQLTQQGAYVQTAHLMVSDHRRPWTLATPGVSQMRCRPLRKEYAVFLKVLGSYWSGNTAGDNIFHSFVVRGKKFRQKRTVVDSHASR
ncbi:hypothetical protein evm_012154 [Chilo suppressalis]|nr:hypothetical protein evm_012154 [Chilo suppressalis]